jgi:hypothetical protein
VDAQLKELDVASAVRQYLPLIALLAPETFPKWTH